MPEKCMEPLSQFEEDKQELLNKAISGIIQLTSNLDSLNRNLETVNTIGSQFKPPAYLWESFHEAITISETDTDKEAADINSNLSMDE
ncbi:hypothetical protein BDB01DRAFT_848581 [Pilobolus umbonatus]|nr:hypothetical protein BDB01DRAFT_848581 [Pilobolus umbonatus]